MARTLISLASVFFLASACATSSAPAGSSALKAQTSATPQSKTVAADDDDKLICEMERPVGSNIPKRVCRTKAQMDREREAAQEQMREATRPGPKVN